jgi:hypothetical protein
VKYIKAFLIIYVISFALFVYLDLKKEPPQGCIRGGSIKGNCNALTPGRQPT